MSKIMLTPLTGDDREQFILDNQYAFRYGAMEEFGDRDSHFEEDGQIISRKTIESSIDGGVAYRIREDGRIVGGLVLKIDKKTGITIWIFSLWIRMFTARASGMARGRRLSVCIRKQKSGRPVHRISRSETSIFMSINAVFILLNSSTDSTLIRMIRRPAKKKTVMVKISTECSVLKSA